LRVNYRVGGIGGSRVEFLGNLVKHGFHPATGSRFGFVEHAKG